MTNLARMIDHTLLKADATTKDIETLCEEAKAFQFYSVCVHPTWVKKASELLEGSNVKVCTVVGFPLGATTSASKAFETNEAIENGANEVDMVINIGALKSGNIELVEQDIKAVVIASGGRATIKVIIETSLLSENEKKLASQTAVKAGTDYVKTSTGFSTGGATAFDIALIRKVVGPNIGIKASGGVRDRVTAEAVVKVGATRIGTSSGIAIITEKSHQ